MKVNPNNNRTSPEPALPGQFHDQPLAGHPTSEAYGNFPSTPNSLDRFGVSPQKVLTAAKETKEKFEHITCNGLLPGSGAGAPANMNVRPSSKAYGGTIVTAEGDYMQVPVGQREGLDLFRESTTSTPLPGHFPECPLDGRLSSCEVGSGTVDSRTGVYVHVDRTQPVRTSDALESRLHDLLFPGHNAKDATHYFRLHSDDIGEGVLNVRCACRAGCCCCWSGC